MEYLIESILEDRLGLILKGGELGSGLVAIIISLYQFGLMLHLSLINLIPENIMNIMYFYLFLNGVVLITSFTGKNILSPKAVCPRCKAHLDEKEVLICPGCGMKLNSKTEHICPNCGKISFENGYEH